MKLCMVFITSIMAIAYSHPIHMTETHLYLKHDHANKPLPDSVGICKIILNWQQAAIVVELESQQKVIDPSRLNEFKNLYFTFIQKHLIFINKGDTCTITQLEAPLTDDNAVVLKDGIAVWVEIRSHQPISVLKVRNTLFTDKNKVQENAIYIKDGPDNIIIEDMLTEKKEEVYFNISSPAQKVSSLPHSGGSRKGSFLDRLTSEVFSTGEKSLYLAVILVFLLGLLHTLEAGHSKLIISSYMLNRHVTIRNGLFYASVFTLTHIADIVILGVILLFVNSFVDIYAKMAFLQTFSIYALFFIALFLLFRNTAQYVQTRFAKKSSHTHAHASEQHTHDHHHDDHESHTHPHDSPGHNHGHEHAHDTHSHDDHAHLSDHDLAHARSHGMAPGTSLKEQLVLGFVTGLSPCLMGWSIFMMILSTRNLWSLFPIIFAFGLGIFLALSLFVVVIGKSRKMFYGRFTVIQELSPIISSLLLLGFATMLLL